MKYNNIPKGYVLVTKKTEEISKELNLGESDKNILYRELLKVAKKEGKKYNNNPKSRIWLLNENIDIESILNKLGFNKDKQLSFDDIKYTNIIKSNNNNYKKTINLIKNIINSNVEPYSCLRIIKSLIENQNI